MNRTIKISICLWLLVAGLFSGRVAAQQHTLGFRGGYSIGMANFEPTRYLESAKNLSQYALVYVYTGTNNPIYESLSIEINYSQRGFAQLAGKDSPKVTERTINSIEVPFLWRPNVTFAKDKLRVFASLGMYVYYDLFSKQKEYDKTDPSGTMVITDWKYDALRDNRIGFGVVGGAGFGVKLARNLELAAEFRYVYSFSSVFRPAAKYVGNPVQSTTSQMNVSLGLYYTFNKHNKKK